jgi:hypothetical protein
MGDSFLGLGAGSSAWYTQLMAWAKERPVRIHSKKNRKAAGSNPARSTIN